MLSQSRLNHLQIMEQHFNALNQFCRKIEQFQQEWQAILPSVQALEEYYRQEWRADYEADEQGEIPSDIPRGVLSQDGLYNTFIDYDEQRQMLAEFLQQAVTNDE